MAKKIWSAASSSAPGSDSLLKWTSGAVAEKPVAESPSLEKTAISTLPRRPQRMRSTLRSCLSSHRLSELPAWCNSSKRRRHARRSDRMLATNWSSTGILEARCVMLSLRATRSRCTSEGSAPVPVVSIASTVAAMLEGDPSDSSAVASELTSALALGSSCDTAARIAWSESSSSSVLVFAPALRTMICGAEAAGATPCG